MHATLGCLIGLSLCAIRPDGVRVGDRAPALTPERTLQAPVAALAGTDGHALVLEFWGTWCGPCLAAIPHLNELADSFRDRPIRFVAATDQGEDRVAPLLKRRPMKAWVAIDTDRSMFEAYGVEALPHTVLVDRAGAALRDQLGVTAATARRSVEYAVVERMQAAR